MKKILVTFIALLSLVSVGYAGIVPSILPISQSTHYYGASDRSFDLGAEGILDIRLEFAVYSGQEADTMQEWTGHTGDADFVYAYQVFCEESSTAALNYFALTGVNPSTISDVQNDIGEAESLQDGAIQSEGVAPVDNYFNDSVTKAVWEFEDGTLVQGDQSWFLFLYSDYDWIAGEVEVSRIPADDDIPVPEVPEPATLVLLACGSLLSLKRRK